MKWTILDSECTKMNRRTKMYRGQGGGGDSTHSLATATERSNKSALVLRDPGFLPRYLLFPSLQVLWPVAFLLLTLSLYWGL